VEELKAVPSLDPRRLKPWMAPVASVVVLAVVLVRADLGATAQVLGAVPAGVLVVGLVALLLRDGIADVGCWWATLAAAGHRAPFRQVLGVTVEFAPLKFLLPFKAGDALRVAALHRRARVPLAAGATTRIAAMVLQLAVLVLATAVLAAFHTGHTLAVVAVVVVSLVVVAAGVRVGIGGRWGALAVALGFAALSAGCSIGLYALLIGALSSAAVTLTDLLVITATVLVCSLPATARGIGLRELMLTTFAVSWGVGARSDLLGVALTVSAVEVAVVLVLAAGTACHRIVRSAA